MQEDKIEVLEDDSPERKPPCFKDELTRLINIHSKENGSDTPDFLLAEFLSNVLDLFDDVSAKRKKFFNHKVVIKNERA